MPDSTIAMFELTFDGSEVSIVRECQYRLVETKDIEERDLETYRLG